MRCTVRFLLIPGLYNKVVSSPYPDTLQPRQSRLQRPQTQFPLLNLRYTGFAGPIQSFSSTIPSPSQQGKRIRFLVPHSSLPRSRGNLTRSSNCRPTGKAIRTSTPIEVRNPQLGIAEALGRERRKTRLEYLGEISRQAHSHFTRCVVR